MEVVSADGMQEDEVLRLAAIAEKYSEHPLARAVLALARERRLDVPDPDDFKIEVGMGLEATHGEQRVVVGKDTFCGTGGSPFPGGSNRR